MKVEIGMGVAMEPATQADIDRVSERFRAGERMECEIFGGDTDRIETFEKCWHLTHDGESVGYMGVAIPPGMTKFAPVRFLCFMSCEAANTIKKTFVRMSRPVLKAVVERCDGWVERFITAPCEEYRGSIIWHERVLRMRRYAESMWQGHRIIHFEITREEVFK